MDEGSDPLLEELRCYVNDIKLQKFIGSFNIAQKTVSVFKNFIMKCKWENASDLMNVIRKYGKILVTELPLETSAENIVRRFLKIVRDEYVTFYHKLDELDPQDSLHKLLTTEEEADFDYNMPVPELLDSILDQIAELEMELETSTENIASEAIKHIHTNETILTIGKSAVVEAFLKDAASQRKFEVIITECSPTNVGHEMAISLSKNKIQTTLIADSAMFGMMSRVNKVIIGTQAVMANGGLRAICGTHAVALAAKYYSVPVIVLAGMYKLSPQYVCSYDQDRFNQLASPLPVLKNSEGLASSSVHIYNPIFDYVPPELVTLFISNVGGHAPSYVYRLLSELYHPDDYTLN